jgi:hypothetical protein
VNEVKVFYTQHENRIRKPVEFVQEAGGRDEGERWKGWALSGSIE